MSAAAAAAAALGASARVAPRRQLRVVVHAVGRTREVGWETHAAAEYTRRLARGAPPIAVRTTLHSTPEVLADEVLRLTPPVVILDQEGDQLSTEEFAEMLFARLFAEGPRASFVVGGAGGLPPELRAGASTGAGGSRAAVERLSLSRLTLPHRMARVLLLEQIFRARELWSGDSQYHRSSSSES
mmetsp:Transcript_62610/g.179604  ORF Transcript_62610/g.179604 Transcript_62610/m.179604 type:complete len:185 (-) Transcript_62610:55-609(-)